MPAQEFKRLAFGRLLLLSSVGVGILVGGPQMLPMAGGYGPGRKQGSLIDPNSYGAWCDQSSPRNTVMACFRGSDPMYVPGSSGEYSMDVFAKSKTGK